MLGGESPVVCWGCKVVEGPESLDMQLGHKTAGCHHTQHQGIVLQEQEKAELITTDEEAKPPSECSVLPTIPIDEALHPACSVEEMFGECHPISQTSTRLNMEVRGSKLVTGALSSPSLLYTPFDHTQPLPLQ